MFGLPFSEIWAADFEYTISKSGARPSPVCLVANELISGRSIRLWQDDFRETPPFRTDADVLFVAYYAPAELSCFLALGWPLPARILDLYVEFRAETNGLALPIGRGLLGALSHHGIPSITSDQKKSMRDLVLRGGPWTESERRDILDYCATDVDCLGPLLERMLHGIRQTPQGFGQALLRGRYTAAVARMEHTGIPIDVPTIEMLRRHWGDIKLGLIADIDKDYGVYEGTTFKAGLFASWLDAEGITWPLTASGHLQLDQDTFRDMAKTYPKLAPLRELRHALSEMRLEEIAVGPDGRNRTMLSPFGARTGRNTPSNTKFIFGPAVWLRGLIKPPAAQALAYIDWSSQEVAIAAALSGDAGMRDAVQSGDPYLTFAKRSGLAPPDATKATHAAIREVCKTVVLGTNYGMGPKALALRTGLSVIEAQDVLRKLATTFPTFWDWAQHVIDVGILTGRLSTVFGWPIHITDNARPTALRNYPMQANGAEMLRLSCCLATEQGVAVCAPIHDALLVEGDTGEIGDVVNTTRAAMTKASRDVLGDFEIATDVTVVAYPDRYADPRGQTMWERVIKRLQDVQGSEGV
jgi:DNA polymerase I